MKILLVDDEKTEREGMKFLLDKFGFDLEVAEAQNGQAAFEIIQKQKDIDILLTDVKMPYMDGLELAQKVKEYDGDIVIIIFSAYSEFDYAKRACEANAVNYLLKPVEVEEFQSVMTHVTGLAAEKRRWSAQKENLRQSDKKLWLYRLFNSKEAALEIAERLKTDYRINLDNKYMYFFSVETGNNFFESKDGLFEEILKKHLKNSYETVNLYPNLSYVLVYARDRMDMWEIEQAIRKIYAALMDSAAEMVSIIVGTEFYGMKNFHTKLKELENTIDDTFSYFSGVIYCEKKNSRDIGTVEETLQMKESIFRGIEDGNLEAVKEQLEHYLQRLEREKASSAFYVKYLLLDIVKAVYQKYGIYNENVVLQTADDIMNSHDLKKVEEILNGVMNKIAEACVTGRPDVSTAVAEIEKVIRNEYMHDIGLEDIAEKVCLTPSYVSFIFKKETGSNLIKYLTDYRMKKAKELLEESNLKIVEIGRSCGYQNQPYFNRLFKNYYGLTPKQYREK